jgi:hypothetical protein
VRRQPRSRGRRASASDPQPARLQGPATHNPSAHVVVSGAGPPADTSQGLCLSHTAVAATQPRRWLTLTRTLQDRGQ